MDTHERMVRGAVDLLRRRGLSATSFRDLVAHTSTPRGSIYHHFPRGKEQLVEEAVHYAARQVSATLEREFRAGAVEGVRAFLAIWRSVVVDSDYRAGCPVLAVALEEHPENEGMTLLQAADSALAEWAALIAAALKAEGVSPERADRLGTFVVAAVEGTVAMCRARRDAGPLDDVGAELDELLVGALRQARSKRPG
ncbi:TetR/AcrR family transcriptional regulator [Krasilnikovia sp. MM14-A1259]|uniref:TetR/AcrR family transcriptional regulator n=1 Tax=Krasilnikovia sp. MM14-A1259 TaxID=3373539 RepID=UPI0038065FB5